ncbi:MAG: DNA polymerase III subunit beta [Bacilli bacterium]|nr:DNA polymerase III subunit beta [Bacilli bacterium]
MKFTIEKNVLLENLSNVVKAISTKNIIPILNGVKFELNEDGLYLTASDSELTIRALIEKEAITKVESEGSIIIQSKYILDIIRKMPSDLINFELMDGLKIKISSDNSQYDLNCLDPKEYPTLKLEENDNPIIIKGETFKTIISQTSFAISTQELRPLLTGLNFKIVGDVFECIATDSYRLAKKNIKLDKPSEENINIVIPGKNIMELDKIITEDDDVEMHVFSNKVLFKYKNIIFQSNLLSGTYPNTSNLIPTDFAIIVNTKLSDYFSAIDRAALLTQSKDKNIVKMRIKGNQMVINSYASEIGKVEEKLEVESSKDASIDISFSAKYMLDALKTMKDEDILILLNGEVKPIVIKSVTDESLIQLILPIKTY